MISLSPTLKRINGFTLIELVVVLAGLGILSSLAIPNVIRLLDFNNIDEAKALLNTAAADCLQKSRLNDVTIENEILSDVKLNTIGYVRDKSVPNDCTYLQLNPSNAEDELRYPIGFSVSDGKLSKFAEPKSTDKASKNSCENWAGINCKEDESLKALIAWKNKIREESTKCEKTYSNYIQTKTLPSGPENTSARWNTTADSGCPTRPPKDASGNPDYSYKSSNTCTPNGCNRTVYGLDGEFVGFTKPEYFKALEAKYGRECKDWVTQKERDKYTNSPDDQPQYKTQCGATTEFWFYKGKNYGSKQKFDDAIRNEKIQTCTTSLDNKIAESKGGSFDGEYTPSPGGPDLCSVTVWLCDGKTLSSDAYKESSCKAEPPPEPPTEPPTGPCKVKDPYLCGWLGGDNCDCE